ncbi:hypothetical protein FXO38_00455 [Capsicum annuum]|nr:hypothetical protein FXO38_00455 [Capsicum annuum]
MSLLYKRYLNQEQKIMNKENRNLSKEMIQMLIALPSKSWSKPSALIVILESCFEKYLDLSEDKNARFQMKMVYDLLKHKFMYENKDKMDEVWINYCGMPVCFGWKEFAIVTGLKCYPPSPSQVIPTLTQEKCARATEEQHELKKVDVTVTAKEHNMTVDNPSTASKDEEKVEPIRLEERKNYPFEGRHFEPSSEIQKLAKILPTYLNMSGFLDQKVHTNWSMIEAYRDKMANLFDVQYVDGIAQQTIGSLDCGSFIATYVEYLSDGLQVPNDELDAGLLRIRYAALLWKYGEAKAQKPYATDVKDPRRPKSNSIALDEEQLVHID